MSTIKEYKQYFTPSDLADFMVNLIPNQNINTIIDLSMGECGLLEAAKKRWNNACFFGVDIDSSLLNKIHQKSPYIHTFAGDSLGQSINSWHEYQDIIKTTGFNLAIANPPFNYYNQQATSVDNNTTMVLPIEMRFLLKYIDIINDNGYICIVLPYGFLSLDLYNEFRIEILKQVTFLRVIKIFKNCFERIDVDTCLLLLQKKDINNTYVQNTISVEYLEKDFSLKQYSEITISPQNSRIDLEYHKLSNYFQYVENNCKFPIEPLHRYVTSCKRGKTLAKKKDLIVERGIRFLHTTDVKYLAISNQAPTYVLRNVDYFQNSIASPENILIGRVGRACIGKLAIIPKSSTRVVVSDCLFSLDIKDIDPYYLVLYLASEYGQMQLNGLARGSCSKYITKKDLLHLKIIIPKVDIQKYFREKYLEITPLRSGRKKETLLKNLVSEVESFFGKE